MRSLIHSIRYPALLAAVIAVPSAAETQDSFVLDLPTFEQLCTAEGGVAGTFGAAETPEQAELPYGEAAQPLTAEYAPFFQSETWFTVIERQVQTLRYEARTTETIDARKLAALIAPLAEASGWIDLSKADSAKLGTYPGRWGKQVSTENGPTQLFLFTDGGIETTSLYCIRSDLQELMRRDMDIMREALLQTEPDAQTAADDAKE